MKATEIRIGNLVNYKIEDELLLTTLNWQDLKWLSEDEKGFNVNHSPITLTEEWLIDLGAKRTSAEHTEYRIDKRLFIKRGDYFHDYGSDVRLDYVHQLQNLFFALTGEELQIKK